MTVPYAFGAATTAIPLSQLDDNFNTTITLGNTAIQLGNTVTTLNNMTLANVTISSGNVTLTNVTVTTANATTVNTTTLIATTANVTTINATDINVAANVTLNGGTANGVAYLNGSKVLTTGSALTFDGAKLVNTSGVAGALIQSTDTGGSGSFLRMLGDATSGNLINWTTGTALRFATSDSSFGSFSEKMRLTSTSLYTASGVDVGIGTSSPGTKLEVDRSTTASASATGSTTRANSAFAIAAGGDTNIRAMFGIDTNTNGWVQVQNTSSNGTANFIINPVGGNLGLGVTPSAWTDYRALQVGSLGSIAFDGASSMEMFSNVYYASGAFRYISSSGSARPTRYAQGNGNHYWFTAPSGTAGDPITFTQAMTLDASGRLAIGDTNAFGFRLHTNAGASVSGHLVSGTTTGVYTNWSDGSSTNSPAIGGIGNNLVFATGASSNTERARIDSSGNLLIGKTDVTVTTNGVTIGAANYVAASRNNDTAGFFTRSGTDGSAVVFYKDTTVVGSISVNASATAYNTSSDYRLKDITGPITTSGAYIDSLNPVEGTWKADGSTFVGLIAHEVQEASRTNVATGTKDGEEMQGMDYSSAEIIANLIAELQSLRRRVAQLEGTQP